MSGYSYTAPAQLARAERHPAGRRQRGVGAPLLVAALSALALALVWVVAELVPATHLRDALLLQHFVALDHGNTRRIAEWLPRLVNPFLYTIWAAALVLIALARERPRVALAVAIVLALAPFSSEPLKLLLAHPHVRIGWTQVGPASYPSGHSTAAGILAMCAVLVAPPRLRPSVAAGAAAFALAVGVALLIRAWHMPSDVLGGYLTAMLWAALAVAGVRASERRWPRRPRNGEHSERPPGTPQPS